MICLVEFMHKNCDIEFWITEGIYDELKGKSNGAVKAVTRMMKKKIIAKHMLPNVVLPPALDRLHTGEKELSTIALDLIKNDIQYVLFTGDRVASHAMERNKIINQDIASFLFSCVKKGQLSKDDALESYDKLPSAKYKSIIPRDRFKAMIGIP